MGAFTEENQLILSKKQYELFNNNSLFNGIKEVFKKSFPMGTNLFNIFNYEPDSTEEITENLIELNLVEQKLDEEEEFIDAFNSILNSFNYKYLKPLCKNSKWADIYLILSQNENENRVAKVYNKGLNGINKKIFESDVNKLMKINQENVVKVFNTGFFEFKGLYYFFIIMEYIKGKDFKELNPQIFFEESYIKRLRYFEQALDGINEFRKFFETHNDLFARNIMITDPDKNDERKIVIIDPGYSKFSYDPEDEDSDLYSIKEELVYLFLKQGEIAKITENISLRDLEFPEFRTMIKDLIREVEIGLSCENDVYKEYSQALKPSASSGPSDHRIQIILDLVKFKIVDYYREIKPDKKKKIRKLIDVLGTFNPLFTEKYGEGRLNSFIMYYFNVSSSNEFKPYLSKLHIEIPKRSSLIIAGDFALKVQKYMIEHKISECVSIGRVHGEYDTEIRSHSIFPQAMSFDYEFKPALKELRKRVFIRGETYEKQESKTEFIASSQSRLMTFIQSYSLDYYFQQFDIV